MADIYRARLERVFETLKKQGVTPILKLTGATGVRQWHDYLQQQLTAGGDPSSWVAAAPGSDEEGGTYWDLQGRLRYRCDDALVTDLFFWFPQPASAQALTDALMGEQFDARWSGAATGTVRLLLAAELEDATVR